MRNRRTPFMLTGITLVGFAIAALPQLGLAQSSPLIEAAFRIEQGANLVRTPQCEPGSGSGLLVPLLN
jgi:hypothetical protein